MLISVYIKLSFRLELFINAGTVSLSKFLTNTYTATFTTNQKYFY